MTTVTVSAKLQDAIDKIPAIREYVWDTSPYEPVAEWEDLALTAIKEVFGDDSRQAAELSDAIDDEQWRNTNRPDSVPPEVFVNKDFQRRIDNIEEMLKGYMKSLSTRKQTIRQKPARSKVKMVAATAGKVDKSGNKKILKQLNDIQVILRDLRNRQMRLERRLLGLRRASKRGPKGVYDAKPRKLKR